MNMRADELVAERLLQRCVDGEMSETEQQEYLRQLEHAPNGWRSLALAFVEHQLWSRAGQSWIDDPEPIAAETHGPAIMNSRQNSWLRSAALLASCLLAVGLGYLGGTYWRPGSPGAMSIASPGISPTGTKETESLSGVPNGQLASVGEVEFKNGSGSSIPLPLIDATKLPRNWWVDQEVPVNDQSDGVRAQPRYLTVPFDQHRNMVVPVSTMRINFPVQ